MAISPTHPHVHLCTYTLYTFGKFKNHTYNWQQWGKSFILKRFFLLYLKNNALQGNRFSGFHNLVCEVKLKVVQLCQTLRDPMDYTVHGILQARILEWVAFPPSRGSSQPWSLALQEDSWPAEPPGRRKL